MKEGILVIHKPHGMTSHDVVDRVRAVLRMRRVGHAGTLDPLATGVLVILVGKSTKLFGRLSRLEKEYRATLRLGIKTSTGDIEGEVLETKPYDGISRESVEKVFGNYIGEIMQVPPMVSAIKYKGKKLYELARKGIEIERAARKIKIDELKILSYSLPDIEFLLTCSSGTYVRQLAEDVARDLGTAGCISALERTRVGPFHARDAVRLDEVSEEKVISGNIAYGGAGC